MTKRDDSPRTKAQGGESSSDPAGLNEWGIPDWRDASAYGDIGQWSLDQWRWEFFRRREDLREYFDLWAEQTYQADLELSRQCVIGALMKPDEPGFCARGSEEATRKFGYIGVPNPRISLQPRGAIRPFKGYSVTRLVDGAKFDGQGSQGNQVGGRLRSAGVCLTKKQEWFLSRTLLDHAPVRLESNEVAIKFDLNEPLETQIDEAREMLREYQSKRHGKLIQKRRHSGKWLGYLRTLDAREAGASWAEISEIHLRTAQTKQSARDIWEQARALCFNF